MKIALSLYGVFQAALIILKLLGLITVPWLAALAPLWFPCVLVGSPIVLLLTILIIGE